MDVGQRAVAANDRQAEVGQNGRDVHVLELDGSMGAADAVHQGAGMVRLYIGLPCLLGGEHGEVVGDDEVELFVGPVRADLALIRQAPLRNWRLPQMNRRGKGDRSAWLLPAAAR